MLRQRPKLQGRCRIGKPNLIALNLSDHFLISCSKTDYSPSSDFYYEKNIVLRFVWWDNKTKIQKNFFTELFESAGYNVTIASSPNQNCDIEIIGVVKPQRFRFKVKALSLIQKSIAGDRDSNEIYPKIYNPKTKNAQKRIWFTMENIRPPIQKDLDLTLSYDQFDFNGTNLYLPTWYMLIGLFKPNGFEGDGVTIQANELLKRRILRQGEKTAFACAIIGNPHQVRLHGIGILNQIGRVDVYGRITGRIITNKKRWQRNTNIQFALKTIYIQDM